MILIALVTLISFASSLVCPSPLIYEFIEPFDIPVSDVATLARNEFSSDSLQPDFTTPLSVKISSIIYHSAYDGSARTITPKGDSIKHSVTNDSILFTIIYNASVLNKYDKLLHRNYVGTTVAKIFFTYTKQVTDQGLIAFSNVNSSVDVDNFNMTFIPTPVKDDEGKLVAANKAVEATSIYLYLKKLVNVASVGEYLKANAEKETFSHTYENVYTYEYNGKLDIDMSLLKLHPISQGMGYGMKGIITERDACSQFVPSSSPYHTLFTYQFIINAIAYFRTNYKPWTNIPVSSSTIKSNSFKFRVIDLEFVVPALLADHSFLEPVSFTCGIQALGKNTISDQIMNQEITWNCMGSSSNQPILNFTSTLLHAVTFTVEGESMTVRNTQIDIQELIFSPIGEYVVVDSLLAGKYIKETFNDLAGITVGTHFKLKAGSKKCFMGPEGLYVG